MKHRDGVQVVGVVLITSLKVVKTPGKNLKNFINKIIRWICRALFRPRLGRGRRAQLTDSLPSLRSV